MQTGVKGASNRLKLIVVIGFQDSGKTTLISKLYTDLTGKKYDVNDPVRLRNEYCIMNSKRVKVHFGLDGDSEDCVMGNIVNIARADCDVAIVALSRSTLHYPSLTVLYIWQKWIDRSIHNLATLNPPLRFSDHERYNVHTAIPQYCDAPDYTGRIGTQTTPQCPNCTSLSDCTRTYIRELLKLIV